MITDAALRVAAKEASLALAETLVQGSKQQPPYSPSKSFTRKMSRLCRRERHPVFHRTMQRVAAVFLALLLTGIGWLTVDAEARAATIAWFRSISQSSIVYRFLNPMPQQTLPDYAPTWRHAIYLALDAFCNREDYDEAYENPLPKLYRLFCNKIYFRIAYLPNINMVISSKQF